MDAHEDIHRAIENYLDANEFRRCLNAALQNLRGVTFLLQKRKTRWKDFDEWYGKWQDAARANSIAKWGVDSRNRVVKERDLEAFSQAIISFYGERLLEAEDVLMVRPETTVKEMLAAYREVAAAKPEMRKGWIRVQRRWVDDQLPEHELVSALREVYRVVAGVVSRAHEASGVSVCTSNGFRRHCVNHLIDAELHCIAMDDPIPTGLLDANTGDLLRLRYGTIERDDDIIEIGRERYGLPIELSKDPIEHALDQLKLSKIFLEADGYAGPMLILSRGDEDLRLVSVTFGRDEPREMKMATAVDMQGAWMFDGAVFASELWFGDPQKPDEQFAHIPLEARLPSNEDFFDGDPIGGRVDALAVYALCADGRSRALIQPYVRTKDGVVYGALIDDASGEMIPPFMRPILRRWPKWRNDPRLRTRTYKPGR